MADASHLLDSLKSVIPSKRNNVDEFHNNCYRIILEMTNKVSISETTPCTATLQKNCLSESAFDYFKKVVTIPPLHHLLTRLNVRFDSASEGVW